MEKDVQNFPKNDDENNDLIDDKYSKTKKSPNAG